VNHKYYATKKYSLQEIKVWHKGESEGLQKLIGVGYFNHLFICTKGQVSVYYDYDEWKQVHKQLKKILTDVFFETICHRYNDLISQVNRAFTDQEIDTLAEQLWPIQSIFNEIDEMPHIANE
jgi:hypothetical protein